MTSYVKSHFILLTYRPIGAGSIVLLRSIKITTTTAILRRGERQSRLRVLPKNANTAVRPGLEPTTLGL